MSQIPIRNSPQAAPRRPTPELRVPQPPVAAPAAAASLRVFAWLITADSTCMNPCSPLPMSSTAVKRMFEPLPSCIRSRDLTSNVEGVPTTPLDVLLAPDAWADSYQMLIAPDTVTFCAMAAAGAASAPATATARSFFCIRVLPSIDHLAALARHPGNPVLLGLSGIVRRGVGRRNEIEEGGVELQGFVATSQQTGGFVRNLLI